MAETDFSHPQRMCPGAVFILFTKVYVRILGPTAMAALISLYQSSATSEISIVSLIFRYLGVSMMISFLSALISYYTKKFYIKDGNLVFIHGVINREVTSVPLDRVHSLRTEKGIWFRLLDMRGIIFDTLATRQEEIELILDEYEWKRMISLIDSYEVKQSYSMGDLSESYNDTNTGQTVSYPVKNLLLTALCQNHLKGMAVLGSLLLMVLDNIYNLSDDTAKELADYLDSQSDTIITSPVDLFLVLLAVYIASLLIWLGRVILRYYGMIMSYDKNLLNFTYGLFTRSSCRFFYDKICTIRIKRNFLEKRFGFCTLMLRQALNASAEKEDDNMKLYGADTSGFFLRWWLGEDYVDASKIIISCSGKGVFFHSILLGIFISCAAIAVLCHFQLYGWLAIPILYIMYLVVKGILTMRNSRIELMTTYLTIHSGGFAKTTDYLKYANLEVVRISRSPLTKWFHRVSLHIATSGTNFKVGSLRENEAKYIYELLLKNI